jgi:prolyl 4-hydroxylase
MVNLNDFIQIHENVLDETTCKFLIELFEDQKDKHEVILNDRKPNFTQFNLTENNNISTKVTNIHNLLIKKTMDYRDLYYETYDKRVFPEKHSFEQFRIKRYIPNENQAFDTHVDVVDHETSRRYISFMWYLNDVDEGGETQFLNLMIKPEQGKLIVFPPFWMFPHMGKDPISNPKYILSTYLHYK